MTNISRLVPCGRRETYQRRPISSRLCNNNIDNTGSWGNGERKRKKRKACRNGVVVLGDFKVEGQVIEDSPDYHAVYSGGKVCSFGCWRLEKTATDEWVGG